MKKNNVIEWFFTIGIYILCFFILLILPSSSMAVPKGKASYATKGSQGMRGFDIHTGTGAYHSTLVSLLYSKLVHRDKENRLQPDLAKSWEIGPNWSWFKFHLNEDARFTDGYPVTAEDVKFTFERGASRPKYVAGGELKRKVGRIEVVDKHTVIIHCKSPYPAFLDRCLGTLASFPNIILKKLAIKCLQKSL